MLRNEQRTFHPVGAFGETIKMIEDSNKHIKIVAKTAQEFQLLCDFRDSLPVGCKSQIDRIETGFSVNTVTYLERIHDVVWLPASPREISYDGKVMRAFYNDMNIVVPCEAGVQRGIKFCG